MFRDRDDAAHQLADRIRGRRLMDPLVLAIPRGGVVLGATLARELGADLDVVLARKLRAPGNPELAVGAVAEDGQVYLNADFPGSRDQSYVDRETKAQMREIDRRRRLYRGACPPKPIEGRSVLVVDDGIATGSTMIAALHAARGQKPHELIAAVPVAAPDRLEPIRPLCDDVLCLHEAPDLFAVGQFYEDFRQVRDDEVVALLRSFTKTPESNHKPRRR
jgi:putative phosphoribosyl transferase